MQTQDPTRYQRFMDLETFTANFVANQESPNQRLINQNGIITIPVVVHVLHRGEAIGNGRNISLAQIQSQIDVLNEDFRRLNADRTNTPAAFTGVASDYGFEFRLACQDPNGSPTNGVIRRETNRNGFTYVAIPNTNGLPDENAMGIKMTTISGSDPWPTDRYLNIWVADFSDGTLGYATFPADFATNPNVDGVVIETTSMGRIGNVTAPFDRGRTATHEIGHWLNLRHIWGDSNCGDDFVGDTPQQRTANMGCPGFPLTSNCPNNGANGDMFMNYMDYTDDGCMNIYTNGQRLRGRAIFANGGPRAAFIDNYFRIQQPTSSISCVGNIHVINPTCLPVTWTITSGPATISGGQNTNSVQVQASGTGTVHIIATAGNYTSELDFNINYTVPTGIAISQYSNLQWCSDTYFQVLPAQGYYPYSGSLTVDEYNFSGAITWTLAPYSSSTDWSWEASGNTVIVSAKRNNVTLRLRATASNPCGSFSRDYTFTSGECIGIESVQVEETQSYSLSPNPTNGTLSISLKKTDPSTSIQEVIVKNKLGVVVKHLKFSGNYKTQTLNLQNLPTDIYVIQIFDGKQWQSGKIMKQ